MSKVCRNCNSVLMDTASFCNNCGARVAGEVFDSEKMKKCDHCGAAIYKSARFCTNCGLPVGVPEADGYAGRCERCGTWLKLNAQFCTNCGRRVSVQTYNFTQQQAAPVQEVTAGPLGVQALPDSAVYPSVAEEQQQPEVLPPLNQRPTRKNDYEDNMSIDMDFDLPAVDEIVVSAPVEDVVSEPVIENPVIEAFPAEPIEITPAEAPILASEAIQAESLSMQNEVDENEILSGEIE